MDPRPDRRACAHVLHVLEQCACQNSTLKFYCRHSINSRGLLSLSAGRAASLPGGVHSPWSQITSQKRYGVRNPEQEMKGTRGGSGHGGPHSRTGQTQARRRRRRRRREGGENSGCTDCRQLITCGPEAHARTRARTHTYTQTRTTPPFWTRPRPKLRGGSCGVHVLWE